MALTKHASFQVLAARIAEAGAPLMRTAHRVEFEYEPKPGYLYVRSRAISSRCNDNYDEFPAEEIKKAYRTFIGKPVFVNHHNANHRRARGVIIDAALHEDVNPDGTPDTWVEVLMEVDAVKFPKLAEAIVKGHIERTSMGTDVAYSICSACGNKASSPVDYCQHIPRMKGKRIYRTTASGTKEGVLIREICYGLGFFENSLLVEDPADPTAYFLGVDTRGLEMVGAKTASRRTAGATSYGPVRHENLTYGPWDGRTAKSKDTYVVPSSTEDPDRYEGVTIKQDDEGYYVHTHRSRSDSYPSPEDIPASVIAEIEATGMRTTASRKTAAKEFTAADLIAQFGDMPTALAADIALALTDAAARAEQGDYRAAWEILVVRAASLTSQGNAVGLENVREAIYQQADRVRAKFAAKTAETTMTSGVRRTTSQRAAVRLPGRTPGEGDFVRTQDGRLYTVVGVDGDSARVAPIDRTRREPSGSTVRRPLSDLRLDDISLGYSWGYDYARRGFGVEIGADHPNFDLQEGYEQGYQDGWWGPMASRTAEMVPRPVRVGDYVMNGTRRVKVTRIFLDPDDHQLAWFTAEDGTKFSGPATTMVESDGPVARPSMPPRPINWDEMGSSEKDLWEEKHRRRAHGSKTAITFDQGGRLSAPAEVDTLRDEECPICGEADSYDGDKCQVCGFIRPPEEFADPDLSKAKRVDLHQDAAEAGGQRLRCDNCGAQFLGGVKVAVVLDQGRGQEQDPSRDTQIEPGQSCPQCQQGTLQVVPTSQDTGEEAKAPGQDEDGFAPAGSAPEQDDPNDDFAPAAEEEDEDEDEDQEDDDIPPLLRKKKSAATFRRTAAVRTLGNRRGRTHDEGVDVIMARPALHALAEQQKIIERQGRQITALRGVVALIAQAAGITDHPVVRHAGLFKKAEEDENPAQPEGWANPGESGTETPAVTTDEASTPSGTDDPESQGAGSLQDVTPAATTSVTDSETVLDEPLDLNEQDVTEPVAGTDDLGEGPRGEAGSGRTETEVRIGDPNNPQAAFDDEGFLSEGAKRQERTMASLRLARLQIRAGIASGDDLVLGQTIASSDQTDEVIDMQIETLSKVLQARPTGQQQARPVGRNLVPQTARAAGRARPSLATEAVAIPTPEFSTAVSDDEIAFE